MLKAKYEYFKKNKGSKIGVNEALTSLQEKENYEKRVQEKANKTPGARNDRKTDDNNLNGEDDAVFEELSQKVNLGNPETLSRLRTGIDKLEKSLRQSKNSTNVELA